ncbi:MAG: SUMF1/EgtB/PvdO family nonheme iron enzyme [Gemmataceae bacterium]
MSPPLSFDAADTPELRCFLEAIVEAGSDLSPRLILADWLDEHDRPHQAELLRLHTALVATCCQPNHHPERIPQQARLVELLAAGVRPCLPRQTSSLAEGVDMTFAWIPPGTFLMGSPQKEAKREDNETQHSVMLSEGFYLGIHPATQAQWQTVMGNNPSHFQGEYLPVEQVSWEDCQEFCAKMRQRDGRRYRLPTEAEWEYACRAGTTTPFHFGNTIDTGQANFNGNFPYRRTDKKGVYRQQSTPVGSFPPHAWGLFDMHGNVWEWCDDWIRPYEELETKDPLRTKEGDYSARVLRGGSWGCWARGCRAADRGRCAPGLRNYDCGFRVAFRLD